MKKEQLNNARTSWFAPVSKIQFHLLSCRTVNFVTFKWTLSTTQLMLLMLIKEQSTKPSILSSVSLRDLDPGQIKHEAESDVPILTQD